MSFAPVYGPRSRALILGSWPSPKSWDMGFYYGHPQNRFWPLLAGLTGEPVPAREDIAAKRQLIYVKYMQPVSGIAAVRLPSTSPANAAWTMARLREAWGAALAPYLAKNEAK